MSGSSNVRSIGGVVVSRTESRNSSLSHGKRGSRRASMRGGSGDGEEGKSRPGEVDEDVLHHVRLSR